MRVRTTLMMMAIAGVALAATAALSPEKAAWGKGPVQYIMTPEELRHWNALQTDAEADAFMTQFWAKRDPRAKEILDARVVTADKNFSAGRVKGSMTDRGKIFVLFGPPTRATHTGGRPQMEAPGGVGDTSEQTAQPGNEIERSTWTYEGDVAEKIFGVKSVELRFSDRLGNGDLRLEPSKVDIAAATTKIVNSMILPERPKATPVQTVAVEQVTVPATTAAGTFKTAALETAITDAKAGKIAGKGATITYAEFISPSGDYYVPVGLFVPASAGWTSDAADTFFGAIEDSTGKRMVSVEEPAKPTVTKNNYFYDYTATLPSGSYTATFGLAKAGVPVLVASAPVQTTALAKETVGTSNLVLSDVIETMDAAPVKSPFAFGKLKIVPRTSFSNKDELGYFVEIHNPGIDPTTNQPKMQAKIDLVPPSGPAISAPLSDVQALPLSGALGPGEYAVISGIPLGELHNPLKAGDYMLRVKLVDTVTKKSYTVEQKFKIVG